MLQAHCNLWRNTLGLADNEFGYYEHLPTTSSFLCIYSLARFAGPNVSNILFTLRLKVRSYWPAPTHSDRYKESYNEYQWSRSSNVSDWRAVPMNIYCNFIANRYSAFLFRSVDVATVFAFVIRFVRWKSTLRHHFRSTCEFPTWRGNKSIECHWRKITSSIRHFLRTPFCVEMLSHDVQFMGMTSLCNWILFDRRWISLITHHSVFHLSSRSLSVNGS